MLPARSPTWKWWVCGLLLLATMLNYMDRLTLNSTSVRIMDDFRLGPKEYGRIESAFALAFAFGALVAGWMVDRWNVYWIYPAAVLAWSAAGFATGLAHLFGELIACRFLLGLAESGNWPCALRTTQRILAPAERTMGNSILQSGASIGAILTPLIVLALVPRTDTWRYPFLVIGVLGCGWVILWLTIVRREDLALSFSGEPASAAGGPSADNSSADSLISIYLDRRFWVLIVMVVSINVSWHFFRVWIPLFLQKQHGYSEESTNLFLSAYYIATDLGCLSAGFATLYLARRGVPVHWSRALVFATCCLLTTLSVVAALLPAGPVLLGVLLVIGFGALGLFPAYYSFSQELTVRNQGKLTGTLGFSCWMSMAVLHELVGESVKATGSYSEGMTCAGLAPLVGLLALMFFWKTKPVLRQPEPEDQAMNLSPSLAPAGVLFKGHSDHPAKEI